MNSAVYLWGMVYKFVWGMRQLYANTYYGFDRKNLPKVNLVDLLWEYNQREPMKLCEFSCNISVIEGRTVALWLRHYATNRQVAGSIPDGVIGIFQWQSFRSYYGPGVDSASNRNEYQLYFLGVKATGT